MPYSEIAKALGIPRSTAHYIGERALKKMRLTLDLLEADGSLTIEAAAEAARKLISK